MSTKEIADMKFKKPISDMKREIKKLESDLFPEKHQEQINNYKESIAWLESQFNLKIKTIG